jgi:hypothetical protein
MKGHAPKLRCRAIELTRKSGKIPNRVGAKSKIKKVFLFLGINNETF